MDITLAAGGVILLAMICVSGYGWITLPHDALVPVHVGPGRYNNLVAKRRGLVLHPAAGAVVYLICAVAMKQATVSASKHLIWPVLMISMCVLLVVQIGAVSAARGRSSTGRRAHAGPSRDRSDLGEPGAIPGASADGNAARHRLAPQPLTRRR